MPNWLWIFLLLFFAFFCRSFTSCFIRLSVHIYTHCCMCSLGGLLVYLARGLFFSLLFKRLYILYFLEVCIWHIFGFFFYLITLCANLVMSLLLCSVLGHSEGRNFRMLIPITQAQCRYSRDFLSLSPDYDAPTRKTNTTEDPQRINWFNTSEKPQQVHPEMVWPRNRAGTVCCANCPAHPMFCFYISTHTSTSPYLKHFTFVLALRFTFRTGELVFVFLLLFYFMTGMPILCLAFFYLLCCRNVGMCHWNSDLNRRILRRWWWCCLF
ncbi:hypothetical protein DFP73DRAFT_187016 [Morchella snyderi]|nr:hypothetical protein DFP73DRAFT_187016 [Morchella snyderi]